MTMKLMTVKNTNGKSVSVQLEIESTLAVIREKLKNRNILSDNDCFLFNGSEISKEDENEINLNELLDGKNEISVGKSKPSGIVIDENVEDYRDLSDSQKEDLFRKCQIFRGLVFKKDEGISKSFKELYSWSELPAMLTPRVNTQELSYYSFSKVTQDLNLITNNKAKLALDTPYVKLEAEYSNEKSKTTSTSMVKEYLLAKYLVSKASFELDVSKLSPNPDFVKAVNAAVISEDSDKDKMCNLLHVLNNWGLYIPQKFTLGGALYSTEETQIKDFSQSESEKVAFSASVKAEFASISGGASGGHSSEQKKDNTKSEKYTNIVINQIGGTPGKTKNKEAIALSLNMARYWEIIDIEEFYPSLMLLNGAEVPDTDPRLLAKCIKLMNNNFQHGAVKQLQPYVNMLNYATAIENLINPF